jgi:hypothetical protein
MSASTCIPGPGLAVLIFYRQVPAHRPRIWTLLVWSTLATFLQASWHQIPDWSCGYLLAAHNTSLPPSISLLIFDKTRATSRSLTNLFLCTVGLRYALHLESPVCILQGQPWSKHHEKRSIYIKSTHWFPYLCILGSRTGMTKSSSSCSCNRHTILMFSLPFLGGAVVEKETKQTSPV